MDDINKSGCAFDPKVGKGAASWLTRHLRGAEAPDEPAYYILSAFSMASSMVPTM
jgi:hypothetical protein